MAGLLGSPCRTIPTRVGKTPDREGLPPWSADHPHAGGENSRCSSMMMSASGPSPRGWGKLKKAFGTRPGMKRSELVKALMAIGHDEATCYRATRKDGYLDRYLTEVAGVLGLRSP